MIKMKNRWNYDSICTFLDATIDGEYYTTWRNTDGYIYRNDKRLRGKCAYKSVSECQVCRFCAARKYCLKEIAETGKTIY